MNNAVGAAPVENMMRLGIPVCLGNDGMGNAMWANGKKPVFLHKPAHRDPRAAATAWTWCKMAVYNNAALAQIFWPGAAGLAGRGRGGRRHPGRPGHHAVECRNRFRYIISVLRAAW